MKRRHKSSRSPQSSHRPPEPDIASAARPPSLLKRFQDLLATPVSGASLGMLRILMGLLMMLEAWALCRPNQASISMGTSPIDTYYAGSKFHFHFPYPGFEWLPLFPTDWMYVLAGIQMLAGLSMALGFRSRLSSAIVFLVWAYFFFVESTRSFWQSHYYIELLFSFLLIWMSTERRYSIDALIARRRNRPWVRTVPFWTVFLLRGQLVIAYFYAGVAKLSLDWLADAVPVRWFLTDPLVHRPFESLLSTGQLKLFEQLLHSVRFAYFIAYTGLAFDLSVGFLFLFRRTRIFAMALMLTFHCVNHFVIFDDIGWFPLAGAATALIFLDTDWPERAWAWLKKPRWGRPDWGWLVGGALAFPVVGSLLGWRVKERPLPEGEAREHFTIGRWTVCLVSTWLVWQALFPARHFLIGADARFTYEGMSFSWRLKSERHNARGAILMVRDPEILSPAGTNRTVIDWSKWKGDRVIYRRVNPGRIDWSQLPEIAAVIEPVAGERLLFNPRAADAPRLSYELTQGHVRDLWIQLYGHPPAAVHDTLTLETFCKRAAEILHSAGQEDQARAFTKFAPAAAAMDNNQLEPALAARVGIRLRAMLKRAFQNPMARDAIAGLAHLLNPFAIEGEPRPAKPVLIIDDPAVTTAPGVHGSTVIHSAWNGGRGLTRTGPSRYENVGGRPMIIYTGDMGAEAGDLLPLSYIMDFLDAPGEPPVIYWNSLKDLSPSKSIHISNQAFYLRRYARRVARLWQQQYGRRPVINALTSVSLNGRPFQELVDPHADLATVPVRWFGHNKWIRDLQTPRVPREALNRISPDIGLP